MPASAYFAQALSVYWLYVVCALYPHMYGYDIYAGGLTELMVVV